MDAFLSVASKREVRGYSDRPVPDAAVRRILEAGNVRSAALVVAVAVLGGGPVRLEEDERPVIVLTFGYPAGARDPQRSSPEEWVAGADRKAFEEVVGRL